MHQVLTFLLAVADDCTADDGLPIPNCDPGFNTNIDTGMPGEFIGIFILFALIGLGITVYKVSMARDMASKSGMDPDQATAMTLLDEDGLSATYLASNLRTAIQPTVPASAAEPEEAGRTVEDRLAELKGLLDKGLVTQAEYDTRRAAILESL